MKKLFFSTLLVFPVIVFGQTEAIHNKLKLGLMNLSRVNAIRKLNFHSVSLLLNFKG